MNDKKIILRIKGLRLEGVRAGNAKSNNARVIAEQAARVAAFR